MEPFIRQVREQPGLVDTQPDRRAAEEPGLDEWVLPGLGHRLQRVERSQPRPRLPGGEWTELQGVNVGVFQVTHPTSRALADGGVLGSQRSTRPFLLARLTQPSLPVNTASAGRWMVAVNEVCWLIIAQGSPARKVPDPFLHSPLDVCPPGSLAPPHTASYTPAPSISVTAHVYLRALACTWGLHICDGYRKAGTSIWKVSVYCRRRAQVSHTFASRRSCANSRGLAPTGSQTVAPLSAPPQAPSRHRPATGRHKQLQQGKRPPCPVLSSISTKLKPLLQGRSFSTGVFLPFATLLLSKHDVFSRPGPSRQCVAEGSEAPTVILATAGALLVTSPPSRKEMWLLDEVQLPWARGHWGDLAPGLAGSTWQEFRLPFLQPRGYPPVPGRGGDGNVGLPALTDISRASGTTLPAGPGRGRAGRGRRLEKAARAGRTRLRAASARAADPGVRERGAGRRGPRFHQTGALPRLERDVDVERGGAWGGLSCRSGSAGSRQTRCGPGGGRGPERAPDSQAVGALDGRTVLYPQELEAAGPMLFQCAPFSKGLLTVRHPLVPVLEPRPRMLPVFFGERIEVNPEPTREIRCNSEVRYASEQHFRDKVFYVPVPTVTAYSETVVAAPNCTWRSYRSQLRLEPRPRALRFASTTIIFPKHARRSFRTTLHCSLGPPGRRFAASVQLAQHEAPSPEGL
ncbi:PREDICTED: uncharacterized protein LOC102861376 [Elephantulus edwardii]|uniref:uncharacterized protein LOC102861376 n=1 Tax=Elephantulus edwardii TaxID=28737 RepID=UPI0003F097CE|nr:PREDICTED: uncharacterized protein LOC102861376 [Elephantulus edwardii]